MKDRVRNRLKAQPVEILEEFVKTTKEAIYDGDPISQVELVQLLEAIDEIELRKETPIAYITITEKGKVSVDLNRYLNVEGIQHRKRNARKKDHIHWTMVLTKAEAEQVSQITGEIYQ